MQLSSLQSVCRPAALAAAVAAASGLAPSASAAAQSAPAAPKFEIPKIEHERFTLPNGLTVILAEDHAVPVVALTIWYHVGSKNEKPGRTGFAHLFEHVMFQGSKHVGNDQHFKIIEEAGGSINGSTWNDGTNYYETVPSSELETILWLESDRMGFLLPTLTQAKLDEQRAVVKNERRQRVDNQVFGTASEAISAALYPPSNPYSWPVIGYMRDLDAASVEDVTDFFRTYYAPSNATLVLAGDFTPERAKALIAKYFGPIPRGPALTRPSVPAVRLSEEKRLVLEDARATLPQFRITWPTVAAGDKDEAALDALAWLLSADRTSRLSKLLVYDRQLATNAAVASDQDEKAGQFVAYVSPRPGASLTEIERLTDSVLASVQTTPFTAAELDRYKAGIRVAAVTGLGSALSKAEILAEGQTYYRDPLSYAKQQQASLRVTLKDVQRVAKKYLTSGRVVLSMVKAGQAASASRPDLPSTNVTPTPEK